MQGPQGESALLPRVGTSLSPGPRHSGLGLSSTLLAVSVPFNSRLFHRTPVLLMAAAQ